MRHPVTFLAAVLSISSLATGAEPLKKDFESDAVGSPPAGFAFARTGRGAEGKWVVRTEKGAGQNHVLVQESADPTDYRFPVAVLENGGYKDVRLSVRARPLSGAVDQGFGLVWRYRDVDNYYVTRCNADEDNCTIYHTVNGSRRAFQNHGVKVAKNTWHTLGVEAQGDHFVVTYDGQKVLDAKDETFKDAGKVGLWTKADSVIEFDDLTVEGRPAGSPMDAAPWDAVDSILGRPGRVLAGGVHRYGWPRSDLQVTIGGVRVEPALALGSWAGLFPAGGEGHVMAMGDLVLLADEVNPVVRALQAGGLDVLAIHNHLIGESPQVLYVHFGGHGEARKVATALREALATTKTPLAAPPAPASPTAAEIAVFDKVQAVLGRRRTPAGRVLQVSVPRSGKIAEDGIEVPASAGMATAFNFQAVGGRVASTGDFVLVAEEVNPVIRELGAHGIQVTALHSHMLRETPRLFFLHFWALDDPTKVAEGLKAALARVAVQEGK